MLNTPELQVLQDLYLSSFYANVATESGRIFSNQHSTLTFSKHPFVFSRDGGTGIISPTPCPAAVQLPDKMKGQPKKPEGTVLGTPAAKNFFYLVSSYFIVANKIWGYCGDD